MLEDLKNQVRDANQYLIESGLVVTGTTFGNVSSINRCDGILAIKPSGIDYNQLSINNIVLLGLDGEIIEPYSVNPSSDTKTHIELYKSFSDIRTIVHTHSPYATAFSQAKKPIDCFGTTHADYFNGSIPVIEALNPKKIETNYEKNTGLAIVNHFEDNNIDPNQISACLVPCHGSFVWSNTLESALEKAIILEQVAQMNFITFQLNPGISPIEDVLRKKHYKRKHGPDAYYGQK